MDFPPLEIPGQGKNKKLAIVGLADTTRNHAPFDEKDWDIWSCYSGPFLLKRVDVNFEIHDMPTFKGYEKEYMANLAKWSETHPVFMQEHYDEIPGSIKYPLAEIKEAYGGFFTNTISYMLALAHRQQYEEIAIYGVEMEHGTEYTDQARSVVFFIGMLLGAGRKVFLPPVCQLLKCKWLYGYETQQRDEDVQKIDQRKAELAAQIQQATGEMNGAQMRYHQLVGANSELDYVVRRLMQEDFSQR